MSSRKGAVPRRGTRESNDSLPSTPLRCVLGYDCPAPPGLHLFNSVPRHNLDQILRHILVPRRRDEGTGCDVEKQSFRTLLSTADRCPPVTRGGSEFHL